MADTYIDPYAGIESEEERQAIYQQMLVKYQQEKAEHESRIYETLKKDWDEYRKVQIEQDSLFGKYVITITAGLFGVSLAFIDKLVPFPTADYKLIMVCGWAFFGATLVLALSCHLISSFIHTAYCKDVNENIQRGYEGKPYIIQKHWYQGWVLDTLYVMSFLGFLGGIVCLILFVLLNI